MKYKKIEKFSKNYSDIKTIKSSFYNENSLHLNNRKKIYRQYNEQPNRQKCKNCNSDLKSSFIKIHMVEYSFCNTCGHVNGIHEDTKNFTDNLYYNEEGSNYSLVYKNDYMNRVKKIYLPKIQFLKTVVKEKIKLLDVGCGAGHLVKACELENISAKGIEPSLELVRLGNEFNKNNKIYQTSMEDAYKKILKSDSNVISLIGVLEHVRFPRKILENFAKSNADYLYILVPVFSLSNFIEGITPNVFPRHSSGGHTHFYTNESLNFIAKEFNLNIIGEWWFGQDFADLFRSILISSKNKKQQYQSLLEKYLFNEINNLQNVLDKKKICSEVHMIFRK